MCNGCEREKIATTLYNAVPCTVAVTHQETLMERTFTRKASYLLIIFNKPHSLATVFKASAILELIIP